MKKVLVLAAAVTLSLGVLNAQKNKVTTAYNAKQAYARDHDPADLQKAKTNIDDASIHPDTKDDAKTWFYRGDIYLALYNADFAATMNADKETTDAEKKRSQAYMNTPTANLTEASNSYIKARSLDKVQVYSDGINHGLTDCFVHSQNAGICNYHQEKYAEALPMFELALTISSSNGANDTTNMNNAALSALYSKNYDKAVQYFSKLTTVGYGKANTYKLLSECYLDKGDSVNYRSTIAEGLKKYPTDAALITEDVNIKLADGKKKEAVEQLESLTAQKPNDPEMYYLVGNVYDQLANPTGPDGKMLDKPANYDEYFNKAALNYKKAIELNPNYYDATYNLGVLYYNQGVEYYNRSNSTLADAAKYGPLWEEPLKTSIIYLEKALTLDPKNVSTMTGLKAAYGMLGDTDNYNRMKEMIKAAQGK